MRGVRVIFLDIDGVLNCKKTANPRDLPYIIDSRLLRIFLRMVGRTWAKVVLISDWRHDPAGLFSARYWGIPYVDIVPYLPKRSRGEQILLWLRKHPRVTRYVVIDDDDDELDNLPLFSAPRFERHNCQNCKWRCQILTREDRQRYEVRRSDPHSGKCSQRTEASRLTGHRIETLAGGT